MNLIIYYQFLSAILSFAIGLFVLIKGPRNIVNRIFFLLSLFITGYAGANLLLEYHTLFFYDPSFAYKLAIFFASLHPPTLVLFSWYFPNSSGHIDIKRTIFVYAIGLFFTSLSFTNLYVKGITVTHGIRYIDFGFFYSIFALYFCVFVLYSFFNLLRKYRVSGSSVEKNQLKYVLIGLVIAYSIGATFSLLLPVFFHYSRTEFIGPIGPLILVFFMAYAIVKHRLMDIEVIIRKGIIYSALIIFVAAVYSGIIIAARTLLQGILPINNWVLTFIAAVAIAVGFKPLEEFITQSTDKIFFRKKYNYQKALKDISGAMAHLTNLDRLVDLIVRLVTRIMRLEGALALIHNEKSKRYVIVAVVGNVENLKGVSISENYAIIDELNKTEDMIIRDEIVHRISAEGMAENEKNRLIQLKEEMDKFKAEVIVPAFSKGKHLGRKLIGIIALGDKKSQDRYTSDDLELLRTLSNQAAVALENSILYDEQVKSRDIIMKSEKMAALGTMAAGIVHELKNPLAFIQTVSQMMPLKWDDAQFKETTMKMLPEEVTRMRSIVEGLLEYSRQHELKLIPLNLEESIDKAITVTSYEARKNSVTVKKQLPKDLPQVMGDKNRMMQVLLNLVGNAIQAMRRGGELTISADDMGARVALKITDTGMGIAKERLKEIFNPFFTTKEAGTGLGLAITQKIVEEHKGSIAVDSIVGEGTTFTVYLPVASPS
ncbi:MAG: GAF domain-containing protein [Candidatus Margulisbacteria bacterium]|nr:GAF domain-containing protein [Candidatus Margulisiibacteriota bacterium]MBU1021259.1 GAF domain-containing protein [Candidatus Margulisiibacteriota bacterium]MBU1729252.1 GAF domain-containing protein [Candidatus Margulisiibacteriota bacterium]MBU1954925.1 GAF domain-containing protein [Candidatus Margulisiibacteriota bacterium]